MKIIYIEIHTPHGETFLVYWNVSSCIWTTDRTRATKFDVKYLPTFLKAESDSLLIGSIKVGEADKLKG